MLLKESKLGTLSAITFPGCIIVNMRRCHALVL